MTDNLESNSDKLSIHLKEKLSSSRSLCNGNDAVSENCKNEDMYNASNIRNPCGTPILNKLKLKNINRLVIGHLNINSLPSKFCQLKLIVEKNIGILAITETTLDLSFPSSQFKIERFSMPYRCNRNRLGGGVSLCLR